MRMRLALAGAALAGLGALAGGLAGWHLHRPAPGTRAYAAVRLIAVQAHLDEAASGSVFLAGDSQAELQSPAERVCGREVVNGGVSGASAALYADLLGTLRFRQRPAAAVLTVGTNDLALKNAPRSPEARARFADAAEGIVRRLLAESDRVVVTALPPVARGADTRWDPKAVGAYSETLRDLCGRLGCRFADPFAGLRDGTTGFARTGTMRDALHLSAYRPILRALAPDLCPP